MKIYIKYMVSLRCKLLVRSELNRLNIPYLSIDLGEVELKDDLSMENKQLLKERLLLSGLELMEDKTARIVEKIKTIIIEMIHYSDERINEPFSEYLSHSMKKDYHQLSTLFSKTKGMTIEHYIILHRIERAKELILYDELSISEIAWKLHYSSVAHLSAQFKKMTGLSPSEFKKLLKHNRQTLESI